MGLRSQVIDTVFKGNADPLSNILHNTKGVATDPQTLVLVAPRGTFFCMVNCGTADDDDDVYINTDGASAWTKIYDGGTSGHHLYLPTVAP